MISASEARSKQVGLNTAKEQLQLKEVEENIEKDIKRGYTYYYGRLQQSVVNELIRLGYKVDYFSSQRDGDLTTIRW